MPARRSRNERWYEYLASIAERGGGIEIAPLPKVREHLEEGTEPHADLLWRVRVYEADEHLILCEIPGTLGESVRIPTGTDLIGFMAIGQSRWRFATRVEGTTTCRVGHREVEALRLAGASGVARITRRAFQRFETVGLNLPKVRCSPLLAAESAVPAEILNRLRIEQPDAGELTVGGGGAPELGQGVECPLMNIGGGGVGLRIPPEAAGRFDTSRLYWLEIDLRPDVAEPLCVTARVAHSHLDSEQAIYAGMAFEFAFNPPHRQFIVDQIIKFGRSRAA